MKNELKPERLTPSKSQKAQELLSDEGERLGAENPRTVLLLRKESHTSKRLSERLFLREVPSTSNSKKCQRAESNLNPEVEQNLPCV